MYQAGIGKADVYRRWDRNVLILESGCFRWLETSAQCPRQPLDMTSY
jgi:hypothetical protein